MAPRPINARLRHSAQELVVEVEIDGDIKELRYSADKPIWEKEPETLDFLAVALCQYAAGLNRNLHISGAVTKSQLDRLDEFIQIWSVWRPDVFQRIQVTSDYEVDGRQPIAGPSVLAFSGGVDATFTLMGHHEKRFGRLSRSINLGILVVGWDIRSDDADGIDNARRSAEKTLDNFGAGCATVTTNWLQDFCPQWLMSHIAGVAGILQSLSPTHASGILSADTSYRQEFLIGPYSNNVAVNHLLGTPSFPILQSGGTHTRMEKVRALFDHPFASQRLRVCYQDTAGGKNCGRCRKCMTLQLAIAAIGKDASLLFSEPMSTDRLNFEVNAHSQMFLTEVLKELPVEHPAHAPLSELVLPGMEIISLEKNHALREIQINQAAEIKQLNDKLTNALKNNSWKRSVRALKSKLWSSR